MPSKRRPRPWRTAFVVLVVLLGLLLAAPHAIALDFVRRRVEADLSAQLGVPCRVDRLGFSWFTGVAMQGLEIGNPPGYAADHPCLRLQRAAGDLSLLPLLHSQFGFAGTVDGLQVFLDQRADGSTNLGDLFGPHATGETGGGERRQDPPGDVGGRGPHGFDFAKLQLDLQLRDAVVEIRRDGQLLESLSPLSCRAGKTFDSQHVTIDLDAQLLPAATGAPGRLGVRVDVNLASETVDAMCSTAGLDLQRYEPFAAALLPRQLTALAGVVNGVVTAQWRGTGALAVDGDLSITSPRLAGPLVQGMDLRGDRWTLRPVLAVTPPLAGRALRFDAQRLVVDLGWLRLQGLGAEAAAKLLPTQPGIAFACELDLDALAAFGGPMPAWLRGSGTRMVGEVGVPVGERGIAFDRLATAVAATTRWSGERLAYGGLHLTGFAATGQLRDGDFRLTTIEPTQLNEGGVAAALTADLRDPDHVPISIALRWQGGRLQGSAVALLQYAVPLFAGLDAAAADLDGLCDAELTLRGPGRRAPEQNWLQLLGEWSGNGTLGLREAAVTPAPAFASLLAPFAELGGTSRALGSAGRLAIDSFTTAFTLRRGSLEAKAAKWLAKGKPIGLSGTVRLDGSLDYAFDLSSLLRGHRDGDRVLQLLGGTLPAARLSGSLSSPTLGMPSLDTALRELLQNELENRGLDLLRRSLEKLGEKPRK